MFYSNVLYDTMKSIFLTEPFKCSDKYLKKELYWVIYCYDLKEKNTTIDFTFETMLVSFPVKLLFDDDGILISEEILIFTIIIITTPE